MTYSADMLHITCTSVGRPASHVQPHYTLNNSMAAFVVLIMYNYIPIATTTAYNVELALKLVVYMKYIYIKL